MSNKSTRLKNSNIKAESNIDNEDSRVKRVSTRAQINSGSNSKIDAAKIPPVQSKKVSESNTLPKILSDIVIQGSRKNQESIMADSSSPNIFMNDETYNFETYSTIQPILHQEINPEQEDGGENEIIEEKFPEYKVDHLNTDHITEDIQNVTKIVQIQGLKIKEFINKNNNLGNTQTYFETQSFTNYTILGELEQLPIDCGLCKVDFDTIEPAQGIISISGIVKTAPRLQTSSVIGNRIVGGITNGNKLLEITLPANQTVDHIMKGDHVKVIGAVINKSKGLHVIKVSNSEDIEKITDDTVESLEYFIGANYHI
ncbi:hypothetical protein QAD02_005718 [Eretmocerus hayati]|uniref:Uncharacterized protein n=1 Tax=Eretmocerus hayati TaxID=131215 RepID=A0ACC2NV11_9HYME|nr:hypothetical protein QAD02_005718 [Eretmocerus hayati]